MTQLERVTSPIRSYLFNLEIVGIKLGLDQIRALVAGLGHPDRAYPSIIVAGTNGKGSVTAMLERALRAAGYRTGRYTSPHLVDLEERFVVDGAPVSPETLDAALVRVREVAETLPSPPSFFEATTAAALDLFRSARVGVAVLEVGLGGRLDATNVVSPVAAVITAIDFDHQEFLGDTLEAIAAEKAGVIKPGIPVVLAPNPAAVTAVIRETCARVGARFVPSDDRIEAAARLVHGRTELDLETPRHRYSGLRLALRGRHQVDNAIAAVRVLEELTHDGQLRVPPAALRIGVEQAEWPARLELRSWRGALVLIDGAHNPAGARALASYLDETYGEPLPLVVGAMRDKDLDGVLAALAPVAAGFWFTSASTPRAAATATLLAAAARVAPAVPAHDAGAPMAALEAALRRGSPVVVAGSLYLCGEIRREIS